MMQVSTVGTVPFLFLSFFLLFQGGGVQQQHTVAILHHNPITIFSVLYCTSGALLLPLSHFLLLGLVFHLYGSLFGPRSLLFDAWQ